MKASPASAEDVSGARNEQALGCLVPQGWRYVRLTSVAKLESGHTPSRRKPSYWNGDIPWVSLLDTAGLNGAVISATRNSVTREGIANSSARLLPAGTVIFSRTATVGKSTVMGCEMATSQDFANYICGPEVHNHFLVYLFRYMAPEWRKLMAGSIHNTVYMPVFRVLQVLLPSLAEQVAIAKALSDTDALIESLEQLLAKKRQIKQGAMQELLTGHRRLPGFTGDWAATTFGDIATVRRGASPRPIDSPVWFDENSSVGWVRISDVTHSGMYLRETMQRLSPDGIRNSRPVPRGSLVMTICATVGRPVITDIDSCIHDGFVVFEQPAADVRFLYYQLSAIEREWSRHGQTGSQMNLNTGLINRTSFRLPKRLDDQAAIAATLSDLDAELTALEARIAKTRLLKQGMAQALLTGRIRLV